MREMNKMGAPKGNTFAKGNKGGRPRLFRPKYTKDIIEFFDIEPYRKEVSEKSKEYFSDGRLKKESEKYRYMSNKLPTLYRFAQKIGVNYTTVYRWAEKGDSDELLISDEQRAKYDKSELEELERYGEAIKEFCNAYKAAKEIQKEFLISLGLSGTTPPAAFIFTSKNVTDMRDKVETEHSGELKLTGVEISVRK